MAQAHSDSLSTPPQQRPYDYCLNVARASRHPSVLNCVQRHWTHLARVYVSFPHQPDFSARYAYLRFRLGAAVPSPESMSDLESVGREDESERDMMLELFRRGSESSRMLKMFWAYMDIAARCANISGSNSEEEAPEVFSDYLHLYWMHCNVFLLRMLQLRVDMVIRRRLPD